MSNFNKYIIAIITIILIFFIINKIISYKDAIDTEKQNLYKKDERIFNNLVQYQNENLNILALALTSDESIKEAYRSNNPELIKNHIGKLWEDIQEKKLTYEIHFFKPPAISFVNFSNFKSLGKDVSSVRTDMLWVTSSFKNSSHPLVCNTYAGYRVTTPILDDDGTLLGGLSLGKKLSWLPQSIKNKTDNNAFLVYKKDSLNSLQEKYIDKFMKGKKILKQLILADSTIQISTEIIKTIDFKKAVQEIHLNGTEYSLNIYPIIGFNNNTIAYICTLGDLSHFKDAFYSRLLNNLILILITALIIFFITRFTTIKILKKIDFIMKLTEKIKLRDFSSLPLLKKNLGENNEHGSLKSLEKDIIEMGLLIEQKYTLLEDENRVKTQQLIEQLYTDTLTLLPNTNALFRDLEEYKDVYLAIFNVKSFKQLNDLYGFDVGNFILKEIAQNISKLVTLKNCQLYRFGNDEYILLNTIPMTEKVFEEIVKTTIKIIESHEFRYLDTDIHIDIYAGICFEKEERLEKADIALADAKKQNLEYLIYEANIDKELQQYQNISMTKKIKYSIKNDDILVYFQAIVDKDKKYFKYESLVRMRDGDTILSPYHFLEISTKTKYYQQISQIVIKKSFNYFREKDLFFSINLSIDDILNTNTLNLLYSELQNIKNPARVVFELLESENIYDVKEMRVFIATIKKMGAKIAIDDFGSGYSNFSYLLQIKPDYIKIDGSIIKNIDTDEKSKTIAKTIISFAHELNIKIIAEFVHSKEVYSVCQDLGVDEFQGYYLGEPQESI